MKKRAEDTFLTRMRNRLEQVDSNVVLRSDFKDLGIKRQISRGLQGLIKEDRLVKIGYGVYAKAYRSTINPRYILIEGAGNASAFREALTRLRVRWEPGTAEQEYNVGISTQVPARNIVKLKSRFRRHLSYKNSKIFFEKNINAK